MTKKIKIGAHVSVSGGISKGVERGEKIGAECLQIFAGSPRRYEVSLPDEKEVERYREKIFESKIDFVYIHASYLLNLASEDDKILQKSLKSLQDTLLFADHVKAEGVVYHPGSPRGGSKTLAIEREIKSVLEVLKKTPENTLLVIENTAGQKKIGTTPEEVGYIFQKVNSPRLKVCIDTAHSFQSGNIKNFSNKEIEKWLLWWEKEVGLKNISLFHINDSLTLFDSQHDRHANIGEGHIGMKGIKNLMNVKKIAGIPWILEVPGFDGKGPDKKSVEILKNMRKV